MGRDIRTTPARHHTPGEQYRPSCLKRGNGDMPEEPEIITRMKEAGRNPGVQESYLSLLPHQQLITRRAHREGALIDNVREGIDYLHSQGMQALKLERELERLQYNAPGHFAASNGGIKGDKNSSYKACNGR
ncbi:MAG: hypothetical protein R6U32_05085 [Candidatus Woesearchaeota archaeon]